jgi:hypothetical protein
MKLDVRTLLLSHAKQLECKGCGRTLLAFKGTRSLCHEPPECPWFVQQCAEAGANVVDGGEAEIKDDVSN